MLEINDLWAGYGDLEVLRGISLEVVPGSITAIIGNNGAGKSTLLKAASGLIPLTRGTISVEGKRMTRPDPVVFVARGIAHVPEGRQVFAGLSVYDNLMLGDYSKRSGAAFDQRLDLVLTLFPDLKGRLKQHAGALSGGQQQMLALGRGLMSSPKYLLLDEPSLGLFPVVTVAIFQAIQSLKQEGVGILLVEQNGRAALEIADQGYLLENGSITIGGSGPELLADETLIQRYLGGGRAIGSEAQPELVKTLTSVMGLDRPRRGV